MRGVMFRRGLAAAVALFVVSLLVAEPGWAQGPSYEEQQAVNQAGYLTQVMQRAADTCDRATYRQAASSLRALQARFKGVPLVVWVPPFPQCREPYQRPVFKDGFYTGGTVGFMDATDDFENGGQISAGGADPRPNPTATLSPSATVAGGFIGFNQQVLTLLNAPVFLGVEVMFLGGSGSKAISGIPGTFGPGGIATSAAAANDSTTVKFGGSTDLIGRIGTVIPVGNFGVMVSFDGGVSWQDASLRLDCTAPGACGTNGLPAQSLSVSKTLTGSVIGAEVNVPLLPLIGFQTSANPTWFDGTTVGFQYLHGDYGTKTSTLGVPSQLQIVANQHITTDLFMARVTVPLGDPFMWVRQGGVWVQQPGR